MIKQIQIPALKQSINNEGPRDNKKIVKANTIQVFLEGPKI